MSGHILTAAYELLAGIYLALVLMAVFAPNRAASQDTTHTHEMDAL